MVEGIAGLEKDGRHEIKEKDGVELLAGAASLAWKSGGDRGS